MYNDLQLTLFLVLIEKFDKSQNFSPDWPKLDLIRAESGQKGRKHGAQGPR